MSDQFSQVYFDDFNGSSLDRSTWKSLYHGSGPNGAFDWSGDRVSVDDGILSISTGRSGWGWESGGLSTGWEGQTYGRYEVRAQFDQGQGTSGGILLWPTANNGSDEVNIAEMHRPDRSEFAFTNHGHPNETHEIAIDASQWHTYTLDWLPNLLRLSVDGQVVSEMTHDVPDQPMALGLMGYVPSESEWWFGGQPDGSTPDNVNVNVDYVSVSAWNGDWM